MLPIAKNITQKARCILTMQRTFLGSKMKDGEKIVFRLKNVNEGS